jgi:hypothetical protein
VEGGGQNPSWAIPARKRNLVRRRGGRRRRRRAGEVLEGTNRVLAHVKSPETARGGVRARDGGGKKLGFERIREAVDGYDGWD